MARVPYKGLGDSNLQRVLAHNQGLLEAFRVLRDVVRKELSLPEELREEVRRHLAWDRGCRH